MTAAGAATAAGGVTAAAAVTTAGAVTVDVSAERLVHLITAGARTPAPCRLFE